MSETRLVFIRHGHAQAMVDDVVAGHDGCRGLSDLGREQAVQLRDRFARTRELASDALYSSVLPRAIETAEIIAPALGAFTATRDCGLCELHPGEADGTPWSVFHSKYAFDMRAEPERPMSPGGESLRSFQARVDEAIAKLVAKHRGETVVIVCHGGVITATTLAWLGYALDQRRPFQLDLANTSISEWTRRDDDPWLLARLNDASHLSDTSA